MKHEHPKLFASIQRYRQAWMWLLLYLTFILMGMRHQTLVPTVVVSTVTMIPMLVAWALMQFLMLPNLIERHKHYYYLSVVVMMVVLVSVATYTDHAVMTSDLMRGYIDETEAAPISAFIREIFLPAKYTVLLLCTTLATTFNYLMDKQKEMQNAAIAQQKEDEMKYLRAQINPHFLFNALNCIYALTVTQDEKAPDSILKLSEMFRYVTDQSQAKTVPLNSEIKYLRNYLDFQRIRMEREPDMSFDCKVINQNFPLPPMLLQPIVENCFKHSRLVDDPEAWVHISLRQDSTGLLFVAENSKPQGKALSTKDDEGLGIGLRNVRQRLEMHYGQNCSLKIIDEYNRYKTVMHIS